MTLSVPSSVSLLQNNYICTSAAAVGLLAYHNSSSKQYCFHAATFLKVVGRRTSATIFRDVPRLLLSFTRSGFINLGLYLGHLKNTSVSPRCILKRLYNRFRHFLIPWWPGELRLPYSTYPTQEAEQRYWDSARAFRRQLQSMDARFCAPCSSSLKTKNDYEQRVPVISSYQPALPPLRNSRDVGRSLGSGYEKEKAKKYFLTTKAFCKWHRMTFPDQPSLKPLTAARLKETYSDHEKQEIHRISRLVPNKKAFQKNDNLLDSRRYYYRDMWDSWQEKHSLDVVEVIFETE
ncbi:hypothetical protein DFH05DRAFT_1408634 [Lentinula detonsa]|uniref:Uncharacterized protein n=1 Tax=Lentinula detonsa TaxID=2804962 RepID=A0A9W8TSN2_9AGAR|nr:hypothetical protein DFH05DRAFT_1408634 [Lentinula detonsa]